MTSRKKKNFLFSKASPNFHDKNFHGLMRNSDSINQLNKDNSEIFILNPSTVRINSQLQGRF